MADVRANCGVSARPKLYSEYLITLAFRPCTFRTNKPLRQRWEAWDSRDGRGHCVPRSRWLSWSWDVGMPAGPTLVLLIAGPRGDWPRSRHFNTSGRTLVKTLKLIMAAAAVGAVALTSSLAYAADKGLVGVLMPNKTSQRWINDGDAVKSQLEALGYTVDLQYAQDDIQNQLSQLENEITKRPKALIIASIDGTTMTDALQKAHDAGIIVVAYDRLITKTRRTWTTTPRSTISASASCRPTR